MFPPHLSAWKISAINLSGLESNIEQLT